MSGLWIYLHNSIEYLHSNSSRPVAKAQQEGLRGTCTLRSNFGRPESIDLLLVRASGAASICTFTKAKTGEIFTSHSLVKVFVLSFVFGCSFILFYFIISFPLAKEDEAGEDVFFLWRMARTKDEEVGQEGLEE